MENLKNIDKIPVKYQKKITQYLKELLHIHQEDIISIYIYQSLKLNICVVFKNLDFSVLKKSLQLVNKGIRDKINAPLFLTREHIQTSSDTFPIEFLEMKEDHTLLYGEDVLANLEIEPSHIRFICEQQLKGKLIRIRQAYLEIGLRKKGMELLVKESFESLFPIFRGLLRLKNLTPAIDRHECIKQLSESFEINSALFLSLLDDTKNDEKIAGESIEDFLKKYILEIEKLSMVADRL